MVLEWIVGATIAVSLVSLAGVFALGLGDKFKKMLLLSTVAFAAGTLLGSAFFDLLPESFEQIEAEAALGYALAGILFFFVVEKFIAWHHHHAIHEGRGGRGENRKIREKPFG